MSARLSETWFLTEVIRPALKTASKSMPGIGLEDPPEGLALYGAANALLDSMNLVSFVFILEDSFKKAVGTEIKISADDLLGRATNPFVSLRELAAFLVEKAKAEGKT